MPGLSPQLGYKINNNEITRYVDAPPISYAVFEGGGPLGVAYRNVVKVLEKVDKEAKMAGRKSPVDIQAVCGSSAGACLAFLYAIGCTGKQIATFTDKFDLSALKDPDLNWMKKIKKNNPHLSNDSRLSKELLEIEYMKAAEKMRKQSGVSYYAHVAANVVASSGVYKGNVLLYSLRNIIHDQMNAKLNSLLDSLQGAEKKECIAFLKRNQLAQVHGDRVHVPLRITFRFLSLLKAKYPQLNFKDLYVTGHNLEKKRGALFSAETDPDMEIATAIRISMSIPRFFKPVKYKGSTWIDGGVDSNDPVFFCNPTNHGDRRFQPAGVQDYKGVYNQNLAVVNFRLDTQAEKADFWNKKEKPGFFKRYVSNPITNYFKTKFAKGVNFEKNLKREFSSVKEQYAQQTIQIPTYDTNIEKAELAKKDKAALKKLNEKFNLFNFELSKDEKAILIRNGTRVTKEYFELHKNQKMELKVFSEKKKTNKVLSPLEQMTAAELKELYFYLKSGVPASTVFEGDDAEAQRKKYIKMIESEADKRMLARKTALSKPHHLQWMGDKKHEKKTLTTPAVVSQRHLERKP